ncbi:hypothetical protein C8A05DRAFT_15864 [Staphylotrichum tortipilum]|uniref:CCZ1/INTU/HSP4 first Longin domain-containing protein n=1 Tax=Staphylotrichum tortipilum TaxID=2831512 RepID=A0AAN6MLF8_9PEZI|nr:hypothetical protein C8A05DRAFT_15864 [Staphylotrichum longicolle]
MANPLMASGIVPAQVGFLAIYNPGLGTTDDTVHDQIVYYASASTQAGPKRRRRRGTAAKDGRPADAISREERNERLRQIGLAQGMVEFGRSFSGGKAVDSIDTERSRVVLHELEPGWWILASIDLTRLPLAPTKATSSGPTSATASSSTATSAGNPSSSPQPPPPEFEYSSREVKPAALLLQDLLRAHALFLLHHAPSLAALFASAPRPEFAALLTRYWDLFYSTWNVLLHGNPVCSVFGGVNIAACGELGMGVGEEDRGSGEREVLEGLVGRVEGLVDLVVGRFGAAEQVDGGGKGKGPVAAAEDEGWLGLGNDVGSEDGAVFLGVGALSRNSLRAVTGWMEDIYTWGGGAYGMAHTLAGTGSKTKRRRRGMSRKVDGAEMSPISDGKGEQTKGKSKQLASQTSGDIPPAQGSSAQPDPVVSENASAEHGETAGGMDKMFSYLKLGYGTYWSLGTSSPAANSDGDQDLARKPTDEDDKRAAAQKRLKQLNTGHFLIGPGEPDTRQEEGRQEQEGPSSPGDKSPAKPQTVTVELEAQAGLPGVDPNHQGYGVSRTTNLQPIVYAHRPFIYILLFQPAATLGSIPKGEHPQAGLQTQLAPLHKPLLISTAYRPKKPSLGIPASSPSPSEIYDLVFDSHTLTLHSTIPNIPDPVPIPDAPPPLLPPPPPSRRPVWTRVEALNTHNQLLSMFASARDDPTALERTCKTSRGWWLVWNRVVDPAPAAVEEEMGGSSPGGFDAGGGDDEGTEVGNGGGQVRTAGRKEIFLVRRASDNAVGGGGVVGGAGIRSISASYVGGGGGGGGWADGASRLAQGIGVDTRRYIEGLLSLNR